MNDTKVTWEEEVNLTFNSSDSNNMSYKAFWYSDENVVNCQNMEISLYLIIGGVAAFLIVVGIVIYAIYATMKYKKMYYQLLDEKPTPKEMKEQDSILL